jgi:flagellin
VSSITRIAENTQFGTKKLLDGSLEATSNYTSVANASVTSATVPATGPLLEAGSYSLNVTQAYSAGTLSQASGSSTISGASAAFDTVAASQAFGTAVAGGAATGTLGGATNLNDGVQVTDAFDQAGDTIGVSVDFGGSTYALSATQATGATVQTLMDAFNVEHGADVTMSISGGNVQIAATAGGAEDGATNVNGTAVQVTFSDTSGSSALTAGVAANGVDANAGIAADSNLTAATVLNNGVSYTLQLQDSTGTALGTHTLVGDATGTNTFGDLLSNVSTDGVAAGYTVSLGASGVVQIDATAAGALDGTVGNDMRLVLTSTNGDVTSTQNTSGGGVTGAQDTIAELRNASNETVGTLTVADNQADGTIVSNSELGITMDVNDIAAGVAGGKGTVLTTTDATAGAVFQIGANRDQTVDVSIRSMLASDLGENATNVTDPNASLDDLRTGAYLSNGLAQEAIAVIDKAIDDVTNTRGDLGATQANALESTVNSLRVTRENLTAAESTIRDVDFAAESAEFTKNNILLQSSTSMLAQANQGPQVLLQLIG